MTIKLLITAKVDGGPVVSAPADIDASAYEVINKAVPGKTANGNGTAIIPVQPEDAAHVKLLMITASAYSDGLTYSATQSDGTDLPAPATKFTLDQPHLFTGGAVLAVHEQPNYLAFTNESDKPVTVNILVGRTAGN